MAGEKSTQVLARIDAAIARIDAAAARIKAEPVSPRTDNREAVQRIRTDVAASIADIDRILSKSDRPHG